MGGLERVAEQLAVGCRDHGIESLVCGYGPTGAFRESLRDHGIESHHFPDRLRRVGLPLALARTLRQRRVDVLHTHHFGPMLFGSAAAAPLRIPVVHTEHSREAYEARRRHLIAKGLVRTCHVVCVSEELAAWHSAHFGRRPQVILNGVTIPPEPTPATRAAARALLGVDEGAFVVGCVARLSAEKDHATLLAAFARVRSQHPASVLVLVGGGPAAEEVGRLAASHPPGSVRLLGRRNDVQALYPAFDVVTLSSRREGLPLALLEGMAAGVPAVATAVGEVPTLLADGVGGLAPPGDAGALAERLLAYSVAPERVRSDGARARERVRTCYSADRMIASYVALYRSLTA